MSDQKSISDSSHAPPYPSQGILLNGMRKSMIQDCQASKYSTLNTMLDERKTTFGDLHNVCGSLQINGIRWRGPTANLPGNEVRNEENKENETRPRISQNLKLFQPKQKKVEVTPSKENILHASEHPSSYISKEDYFAGICLIPKRRRTDHRSGCNLIPAVHRKEHLSMKHSTQQTMTKKAVQKEEECLAEPAGRQAGNAPKRTRSGRVVRPSLRYRDWPQWPSNLLLFPIIFLM